jgi:hypothetical protein
MKKFKFFAAVLGALLVVAGSAFTSKKTTNFKATSIVQIGSTDWEIRVAENPMAGDCVETGVACDISFDPSGLTPVDEGDVLLYTVSNTFYTNSVQKDAGNRHFELE